MSNRSLVRRHAAPCLLAAALALALLGGCEAAKPKVKTPARLLYLQGQTLVDQELYTEAVTRFQDVADQNPGTVLGSYAFLQIAEIRSLQEEWDKAETNYRLFLTGNQSTHLTPYVLYQLARVNHKASFSGLIFRAREVDRDQQPNRDIIQEYKRFFFLYPQSMFLDDVRAYAVDARITLAEHERVVGDFYFQRGHYHAAAARYRYLLRNFPEYPRSREVLQRLIATYRRNQQPELAEEMERLTMPGGAPGDAAPEFGAAAPAPTQESAQARAAGSTSRP